MEPFPEDYTNHFIFFVNTFPVSCKQRFPHKRILIPKQIIENVDYFSEDLYYGEDISLTVKIGMEYSMIWVDKTVSTYNRHNDSAISKSNHTISPTERYFQFYEKFALGYFFDRRKEEPFKKAFIMIRVY